MLYHRYGNASDALLLRSLHEDRAAEEGEGGGEAQRRHSEELLVEAVRDLLRRLSEAVVNFLVGGREGDDGRGKHDERGRKQV